MALPKTADVVIVGAGLAGVSAAYQLHKVGVLAHLYEARERLGGRCWTARATIRWRRRCATPAPATVALRQCASRSSPSPPGRSTSSIPDRGTFSTNP
jgi:flavin-dependent dehydrogenase